MSITVLTSVPEHRCTKLTLCTEVYIKGLWSSAGASGPLWRAVSGTESSFGPKGEPRRGKEGGERRVEGDGEELEAARRRERGAAAARDFRVEIWGRGRKFRRREIAEGKYSGSGVPKSEARGDFDETVPRASERAGSERRGKKRKGPRRESPLGPLSRAGESSYSEGIAARRARWLGQGKGAAPMGSKRCPLDRVQGESPGPPRWGPGGVP